MTRKNAAAAMAEGIEWKCLLSESPFLVTVSEILNLSWTQRKNRNLDSKISLIDNNTVIRSDCAFPLQPELNELLRSVISAEICTPEPDLLPRTIQEATKLTLLRRM